MSTICACGHDRDLHYVDGDRCKEFFWCGCDTFAPRPSFTTDELRDILVESIDAVLNAMTHDGAEGGRSALSDLRQRLTEVKAK